MSRYLLILLVVPLALLSFASDSTAQWEPLTGIRGRETKRIVSSGDALYSWVKGNGVPSQCYRSLDSGQTWSKIPGLPDQAVHQTIDFFAKDSLLVILRRTDEWQNPLEVFVSKDHGETFTRTSFYKDTRNYFEPVNICFGSDRIYALGYNHSWPTDSVINLMSTKDFGETWDVDPANTGMTQAIGNSYQYGPYLFVTSSNKLFRRDLSKGVWDSINIPENWSNFALRTITQDGPYLYIGGRYILRSIDSGAHWDTLMGADRFYRHNNINFFGSGHIADDSVLVKYDFFGQLHYWNRLNDFAILGDYGFVATIAGIFRTKIGEDNWSLVDTNVTSLGCLRVCKIGDILYALSESGIHHSLDQGVTWKHFEAQRDVNWGLTPYVKSTLSGSAENLWYLDGNGSLHHSEDTGRTWIRIDAPTKASYDAIVQKGERTIVGHRDGVLRSTNRGKTWTSYTRNDVDFNFVDAGPVIYSLDYWEPLSYSTNEGTQWIWTSTRVPDVTLIAADGNNLIAKLVILSRNDTLSRSTNRGQTWTTLNHVATDAGAIAMLGKRCVVARGNAVDTTADLGTTWKPIEDTLPSPVIDLTLTDQYIYATTRDHGIFRLHTMPKSGVTALHSHQNSIVVTQDLSAERVTLHYPDDNTLRADGDYLVAADVAGRLVPLPVISSDEHSISLDVSALASGLYFVQPEVGGRTETTRFVIQR